MRWGDTWPLAPGPARSQPALGSVLGGYRRPESTPVPLLNRTPAPSSKDCPGKVVLPQEELWGSLWCRSPPATPPSGDTGVDLHMPRNARRAGVVAPALALGLGPLRGRVLACPHPPHPPRPAAFPVLLRGPEGPPNYPLPSRRWPSMQASRHVPPAVPPASPAPFPLMQLGCWFPEATSHLLSLSLSLPP